MEEKENLAALMAEDAESAEFGETDERALEGVAKLAKRRQELVAEKEKLEEQQARISAQILEIDRERIPDMMERANLKRFTLQDGSEITVADEVAISIRAQSKDDAFAWLEANGHGSIIRHIVSANFKKGEEKEAARMAQLLIEAGFDFKDQQDVHWATLKSWYKDELANGRTVPEDLFSAHEFKQAKIKTKS